MRDTARCSLFMLAIACLAVSCGTSRRIYFRDSFRRAYSIQDGEIQRLQFFVSRDVILRTKAVPEDNVDTAERTILIKQGTPVIARSVGPDWIRISFERGRASVAFVTVPKKGHDGYHLATTLPNRPGLHRVVDMEKPVVWYDGRRFDVLVGAEAGLTAEIDDMNALADRRQVTEGREH